MSKHEQNSIVEPTQEELNIYNNIIKDIPEEQLDEMANDYFDKVSKEGLNISFPMFVINKIIRPIKEGDTIQIQTAEKKIINLFCLIRKEIEGTTYLLFAEVDNDSETLVHDTVYLWYVCGVDEIGTEEIDMLPNGEETERILDILEADVDVAMANAEDVRTKEEEV